jgi:hypothetical protein
MEAQLLQANTPPAKISFYYLSNIFLAVLCAITFLLMLFATIKASRLVWPQEKLIPFMLLFLCLSIMGSFAFFMWSLLRVY